MKYTYKTLLLSFLCIIEISSQEIVDTTIDLSVESSNLSIDAQEKIEELDEISKKVYFEYKDTLNEYKSLKNYDDQLSEIIDAQFKEITNINQQLDSLDDINIDILPLLKKMTDTLRKVVELDIPFLKDGRVQRVNSLDELLLRADITTAEKFRKVFEAYQIENEYGRTVESYRDEIIFDNETYNVEVFRLGRVGLYARTSDGRNTAMYSKKEAKWIRKKGIDAELIVALKIAKKELPPELLRLPIERI